nr:hypothetical protein [Dechloromonas sp.]
MSATDRAQIRRATLEARQALETLDEVGAEELSRLYRQAAESIRASIARAGGGDGKVALAELQALLAQIDGILASLATIRDGVVVAGLTTAAQGGAAAVVLDSAAAMVIATEAVALTRNFIAADGLNLADRLWRIDRGAREAIGRAVELAVIQGHGSAQAAREFLARGQPVPPEVAARLGAADSTALGTEAARLMTGEGQALYQAQRVFRTEINRAHGEAYIAGAERHPDFAGFKFLLSPAHPRHDICDLLASQNLYGLGPGVYPSRAKTPWPAHPNTLSFVDIVYADEVSAADRAGRETPTAALARLPADVREGVLGKGKAELFDAGRLRQGMIRSPLKAVRRRVR